MSTQPLQILESLSVWKNQDGISVTTLYPSDHLGEIGGCLSLLHLPQGRYRLRGFPSFDHR